MLLAVNVCRMVVIRWSSLEGQFGGSVLSLTVFGRAIQSTDPKQDSNCLDCPCNKRHQADPVPVTKSASIGHFIARTGQILSRHAENLPGMLGT